MMIRTDKKTGIPTKEGYSEKRQVLQQTDIQRDEHSNKHPKIQTYRQRDTLNETDIRTDRRSKEHRGGGRDENDHRACL